MRASGVAPHAIEWQLGVRPDAPPFLVYVGERRCEAADPDRGAASCDEVDAVTGTIGG